jgi:hypothetical protein
VISDAGRRSPFARARVLLRHIGCARERRHTLSDVDAATIGPMRRLAHSFPVGEDAVWRALRASVPIVTTQATFWESLHRVEWSSDWTAFSWGQNFDAAVESGPAGSSVLTLSGKSPVRPSFADRGRRAEIFHTLVTAVTEVLSRQADMSGDLPTEDRVRYWNGREWSAEPTPGPA